MRESSDNPYADLVGRLAQRSVLVIGDVCLDRYVFGKPARLSREAPVVVLDWQRESALPGAAANPALNIAGMGARAQLVAVTGADAAGQELRNLLAAEGVGTTALLQLPGRRTTEKTRVLAEGLLVVPQQIARYDRSDPRPLSAQEEDALCRCVEELMPSVDAVLVSDYKGGVVAERVIECIRETACEHRKLSVVDSQGDLYRFQGFDCVRCNRADGEAVLRGPLRSEDDFRRELPALRSALGSKLLVVTRDAEGLSFDSEAEGYGFIPAVQVPVADVVGAGDTLAAVLTLALACGEPVSSAAFLANWAAGLVVQHVGNACPTPEELLAALGERADG